MKPRVPLAERPRARPDGEAFLPGADGRNRVRNSPRAKTTSVKRLTRAMLQLEALGDRDRMELEAARPHTRGECKDGLRPCPFVGCRHHLYLDVNPETGSIKLNFPDLEPGDLVESCALDIADREPQTLEVVGGLMNLTRERTRQVELKALHAMKAAQPAEP